jgi:hypothetical protein
MWMKSLASSRIQPEMRCSKGGVVAHVFEHLHREHAIEPARGREVVHVGRHHFDILQPVKRRAPKNELPLAVRIRDGQDPAGWIPLAHPQGEGTPAATKLEDVLTICQPGMRSGFRERRDFGVSEGRDTRGPVAGAVLQARPKRAEEKLDRRLVMLLVGRVRHQRDRAAGHLVKKRAAVIPGRGVRTRFLGKPLAAQPPDAQADEAVGQDTALL